VKTKKYVSGGPIVPDPRKKTVKTLAGDNYLNLPKPVYTSNPNDPRLKAYQDSLTTYNLAPEFNKKRVSEYLKSNSTKEANERIEQVHQEFKEKGFKFRLWTDAKNNQWKEGLGFGVNELVYKKPVQPVVYKKPVEQVERPKVDKAVVKPKGASLSVKKKDLQPQKSLPKSIDSIKMDASGINVYLSLNGKQTVMPKKEFTSWLQNPENRAMYDKYRSSQAKTLKKK
jgi:hypothetical protein